MKRTFVSRALKLCYLSTRNSPERQRNPMLRQLLLIRHAKAATEPSGSDFDRPLTPRGLHDAAALAAWLVQQSASCDMLQVSSAQRTIQTAKQLVDSGWQSAPSAAYSDALYLASAGDLLEAVHQLPDSAASAGFIGHNPGLHQLALLLSAPAALQANEFLELSFPTSACVCLQVELAHWRDAAPASARISGFWTPRADT